MSGKCARPLGVAMFGLVLLGTIPPTNAAAPDQRIRPRICTEFFDRDAVFVGTVASAQQRPGPDDAADMVYSVDVQHSYRGDLLHRIEMVSSTGPDGRDLTVGGTYVLFATDRGGELRIDNGGNTRPIGEATRIIKALEEIVSAPVSDTRTGSIRGRLFRVSKPDVVGIPGVGMRARWGSRIFDARTDSQGWFEFRVPAGVYSIAPHPMSWSIEPYEHSYDPPEHVVIEAGGCADVYFLKTDE